MKRIVFAVFFAVFLCCSVTIFLTETDNGAVDADSDAVVELLSQQGGDALSFQRKLAQWYNLNLLSEKKDRDFQNAYWDILDFTDSAMGYLSVPKEGICLPVYHGTDAAMGIGHLQMTAFPIGGEGNHSALVGDFLLENGDYFYVHILGEVRAYQVQETEMVLPTEVYFPSVEGEEICTLVDYSADGSSVRLIRGRYTESAPQEQSIRVEEGAPDSDGWLIAACIVLALGILLVPLLMWCSRGG